MSSARYSTWLHASASNILPKKSSGPRNPSRGVSGPSCMRCRYTHSLHSARVHARPRSVHVANFSWDEKHQWQAFSLDDSPTMTSSSAERCASCGNRTVPEAVLVIVMAEAPKSRHQTKEVAAGEAQPPAQTTETQCSEGNQPTCVEAPETKVEGSAGGDRDAFPALRSRRTEQIRLQRQRGHWNRHRKEQKQEQPSFQGQYELHRLHRLRRM